MSSAIDRYVAWVKSDPKASIKFWLAVIAKQIVDRNPSLGVFHARHQFDYLLGIGAWQLDDLVESHEVNGDVRYFAGHWSPLLALLGPVKPTEEEPDTNDRATFLSYLENLSNIALAIHMQPGRSLSETYAAFCESMQRLNIRFDDRLEEARTQEDLLKVLWARLNAQELQDAIPVIKEWMPPLRSPHDDAAVNTMREIARIVGFTGVGLDCSDVLVRVKKLYAGHANQLNLVRELATCMGITTMGNAHVADITTVLAAHWKRAGDEANEQKADLEKKAKLFETLYEDIKAHAEQVERDRNADKLEIIRLGEMVNETGKKNLEQARSNKDLARQVADWQGKMDRRNEEIGSIVGERDTQTRLAEARMKQITNLEQKLKLAEGNVDVAKALREKLCERMDCNYTYSNDDALLLHFDKAISDAHLKMARAIIKERWVDHLNRRIGFWQTMTFLTFIIAVVLAFIVGKNYY